MKGNARTMFGKKLLRDLGGRIPPTRNRQGRERIKVFSLFLGRTLYRGTR